MIHVDKSLKEPCAFLGRACCPCHLSAGLSGHTTGLPRVPRTWHIQPFDNNPAMLRVLCFVSECPYMSQSAAARTRPQAGKQPGTRQRPRFFGRGGSGSVAGAAEGPSRHRQGRRRGRCLGEDPRKRQTPLRNALSTQPAPAPTHTTHNAPPNRATPNAVRERNKRI